MSSDAKAAEYMAQGQKTLKKTSFFSFGGGSQKFEDASDLFEKAGNQYKISKKWQEAADAYVKCADCQMKLKESSRAAQFYQQAADALSKVNPTGASFLDPDFVICLFSMVVNGCVANCPMLLPFVSSDAIEYFRTAISMLCDAGRFSNAAKLQKQIAEIYESQDNKEEALESYRQAADYFSGENQASSANNMLLKVAQFSAQLERYDAALEIYESIARSSMESNLLKFNAKNHLLNAGICALATKDLVLVQIKLNEFQEIDYTFGDSREGKFLQAMVQSFEGFNADGFADAVYQFDTISKIEPWKISILLKVKESIMGEVDAAQDLT